MRRAAGAMAAATLLLSGCATFYTFSEGELYVYGGVQLLGFVVPHFPPAVIDYPFSFLFDTLFLPITIPWTLLHEEEEEVDLSGNPEVWVEELASTDEQVRERAIQRLRKGYLSGKSDVKAALQTGLREKPPRVKMGCIEVLGQVGQKDHSILADLVQATRDEHPKVRLAAVKAVGEMGFYREVRAAAVDALVLALSDSDLAIRRAALEELSGLFWFEEPAAEEQVPGLVPDLQADTTRDHRILIADFLGTVTRKSPVALAAAVGALQEAIRQGDPELTQAAEDALGSIALEADLTGLAALLRSTQPQELRRFAVQGIAERDTTDPAVRAALEAALQDPDPEVRARAKRALDP